MLGGLGAGVHREARREAECSDRHHVEHGGIRAGGEVGERSSGEEDRAAQVHRVGLVPRLGCELGDRRSQSGGGVVHDDVDALKPIDRALDELLDRIEFAEVRRDTERLAAHLDEGGLGRRAGLHSAAGDDDLGAGGDEPLGQRPPDSTRPSSHHRDPVVQIEQRPHLLAIDGRGLLDLVRHAHSSSLRGAVSAPAGRMVHPTNPSTREPIGEQAMEQVLVEEGADGIVTITLNRSERRNALSARLLTELHRTFDRIASDPLVRVVIVTGAGDAFCSGADMKGGDDDLGESDAPAVGVLFARAQGVTTRTLFMQELMASLFEKIHRLRQPVVAAVNGPAVGGGFALALACDVRYASESARFGAVFITRGVSACDMGTSYFLPRLVGASRAAELMLTGRVFDAAEAYDMDLVLGVVPDDAVVERARKCAEQIAQNSPLAVWMTKETMWQTVDAPSLRHALDFENRTQVMCSATGELSEAFAAFREGRPAQWQPL
jgi:enoyl-CoA hydratase